MWRTHTQTHTHTTYGQQALPTYRCLSCLFFLRTCLSLWQTLAIPSHEHPANGVWAYWIHALAWEASVLRANSWACICLSEYGNMLKACTASLSLSPSLSIAISGASWNSMKQYETLWNIVKHVNLKVLCRSCNTKEAAGSDQTKLTSARCINKTWRNGKT